MMKGVTSSDREYPLVSDNKYGKGLAICLGLLTNGMLIGELIDKLLSIVIAPQDADFIETH